jgi:hypothetical protein
MSYLKDIKPVSQMYKLFETHYNKFTNCINEFNTQSDSKGLAKYDWRISTILKIPKYDKEQEIIETIRKIRYNM